jgi:hypothetical protein
MDKSLGYNSWFRALTKRKQNPFLTPKISCVLLPNFAIFDIVGKINFSKNLSMKI